MVPIIGSTKHLDPLSSIRDHEDEALRSEPDLDEDSPLDAVPDVAEDDLLDAEPDVNDDR